MKLLVSAKNLNIYFSFVCGNSYLCTRISETDAKTKREKLINKDCNKKLFIKFLRQL